MVQVCGLKLVESQLLASLAAAHARSDAATLRSQRLSAALEAAAAAAKQQSQALPTHHHPSIRHQTGCGVGELGAEVAQLQAQALVQAQEVFELRDQLMQAKQVGGHGGMWVCVVFRFCVQRAASTCAAARSMWMSWLAGGGSGTLCHVDAAIC